MNVYLVDQVQDLVEPLDVLCVHQELSLWERVDVPLVP